MSRLRWKELSVGSCGSVRWVQGHVLPLNLKKRRSLVHFTVVKWVIIIILIIYWVICSAMYMYWKLLKSKAYQNHICIFYSAIIVFLYTKFQAWHHSGSGMCSQLVLLLLFVQLHHVLFKWFLCPIFMVVWD